MIGKIQEGNVYMEALFVIPKTEIMFSPYQAKKALEKIYLQRNENGALFKYVIEKMTFVNFSDEEVQDSSYPQGCIVSFHVKSTNKGNKPLLVKVVQNKINKILSQGVKSIILSEANAEFTVQVKPRTGKEIPWEATMTVKDMLLNAMVNQKRHLVTKVFDAKIEHGVIDLRGVKTRNVYPWWYRMVRADEM